MTPLSLTEARRRFLDGADLPPCSVPESILRSWRRCQGLGLDVGRWRPPSRLTESELSDRRDENADWLQLARPTIDALFDSVLDDGHVLIVADRSGLILDEMGHPDFLDRAERVALTPGMDWREDVRGTNAIGTALVLGGAATVRGGEHFLERNRQLSCTAQAIHDPQGQLLGVIDVSGQPRRLHDAHRLQVEAAVRHIEQRLFDRQTARLHELRLASEPALLATPRCGRLGFDDEGVLRAANRVALASLGLDRTALGRSRFVDLCGQSLEHWLSRHDTHVASLRHAGGVLSARLLLARPPAELAVPQREPSGRSRETSSAEPANAAAGMLGVGLPAGLLDTARRLLDADIPVLLLGETGVGKERFVQALHAGCSRRGRPLVAVNCAAIPEGLIESELFGYEEGAFTGARRQGSKGRLREADGGVLFLDEIGDMPASLQARLLRVLQERVVQPLGGGAGQRVDVRIVAATHRDLAHEVAAGRFRADLYYRLGHYPLRLPPLRERGDVAQIAGALLADHGGAQRGITLSPELAAFVRRYPWPGNLRQLDNLLRTLLALVDDGTLLTPTHLPDTLRDDAAPQAGGDAALQAALARHGGNASAAARALGISRSTLYRRLGRG
ncbi:sigma-54-dependent Fis family transcriptional regulator [Aromatoleum aromaticum]|uniref:sigma-54-dependent Fis family transcriptional regulator n=1 Tax=Aromatoleum aromaticum TaxID=551760 RepID=UPI0014593F28|nr:sigma-54-dependent Fis family transcriptional regulator [Aromatoleum aromaticum]NMG54581.1 AAA domain-containing protein [Aromatoleum aromaticum]